MLLSNTELKKLVHNNVLANVTDLANINGTSIDITLGSKLLVEDYPKLLCPHCGHEYPTSNPINPADREDRLEIINCSSCLRLEPAHKWFTPVDFSKKEPLSMHEVDCTDGFVLWPGEVCLAHSVEVFNLPLNITAEYRLKSSQARVFLEHLHASWCDPGWNGSVLTLEFKNESKFHSLILRAGDKCGQVMFYSHDPVPPAESYAIHGQYNGCESATASKGMK